MNITSKTINTTMKKSWIALAILSICAVTSCEDSVSVEIKCDAEAKAVCAESKLYICEGNNLVEKSSNYCDGNTIYNCDGDLVKTTPCNGSCNDKGECVEAACPHCVNGCDNSGKCKCKKECVNGCDEQLGKCKCPEGCTNECDEETGKCNGNDSPSCDQCENGCDENGKCKCKNGCVNGCDEQLGKCKCEDGCTICDDKGICIKDENNNHMIDSYETVENKSCKTHSDCDSKNGANDGFCDSFIGYRCSTRCTNDSQCMPDETINGNSFHYVCRPDDRCAPDTFETVWKTTKDNESITILLKNATKCEFDIDWGDGTTINSITNCQENLNHEYSKSGNHHVKIKGTLDGWHTTKNTGYNDTNAQKLIEVVSFGPVGLGGFKIQNNPDYLYAFGNAKNLILISTIDIPDSSKLTSLKGMFEGATNFNCDIGNWDTSNVTDMAFTFKNAENFNKNIGNWDTSQVTSMAQMFYGAKSFNQDISSWKTTNVNNMAGMFHNAKNFNQNISKWYTAKVTDMSGMFRGAEIFNNNIKDWNTSKVTDMSYMFRRAYNFNQDIGGWNTTKVENMEAMFSKASAFNQDIGGWNTSNVENMSYMFNGATSFNQDIGNWSTSKVADMSNTFNGATSFNQDISGWNVTGLTAYTNIFCNSGLTVFLKNQILTAWENKNSDINENVLLNCTN